MMFRNLCLTLFVVCSSTTTPEAVHGFLVSPPSSFHGCNTLQSTPCLLLSSSSSSSNVNYSETETSEMKELILSLSLEPTDESRRQRVVEIFEEALARPNGMPKRFTDLFDLTLIQMGDLVQSEAKRKAFESQDNDSGTESASVVVVEDDIKSETKNNDNIDTDDFGPPTPREKTPEEKQLWALVDMMVQSKTIVKRANGDLGSKGTFQ